MPSQWPPKSDTVAMAAADMYLAQVGGEADTRHHPPGCKTWAATTMQGAPAPPFGAHRSGHPWETGGGRPPPRSTSPPFVRKTQVGGEAAARHHPPGCKRPPPRSTSPPLARRTASDYLRFQSSHGSHGLPPTGIIYQSQWCFQNVLRLWEVLAASGEHDMSDFVIVYLTLPPQAPGRWPCRFIRAGHSRCSSTRCSAVGGPEPATFSMRLGNGYVSTECQPCFLFHVALATLSGRIYDLDQSDSLWGANFEAWSVPLYSCTVPPLRLCYRTSRVCYWLLHSRHSIIRAASVAAAAGLLLPGCCCCCCCCCYWSLHIHVTTSNHTSYIHMSEHDDTRLCGALISDQSMP